MNDSNGFSEFGSSETKDDLLKPWSLLCRAVVSWNRLSREIVGVRASLLGGM